MNDFSTHRTFVYRFWQALAWIGLLAFVVFTADIVLNPLFPDAAYHSVPARLIGGLVIAPLTIMLGWLCLRRTSGNIIGYLLICLGCGTVMGTIRAELGSSFLFVLAANVGIGVFWFAFLLIPCYFPTGQLFPFSFEKWGNRLIGVLSIYAALFPIFSRSLSFASKAGQPGTIPNPLFVQFLEPLQSLGVISVLCLFGVGGFTLILRYRAGGSRERLQIRWLLAGFAGIFGLTFIGGSFSSTPALSALSTDIAPLLATFFYPLAVAYAVLRHRLYNIDIIIRRTLIYSILTVSLAALYFGGVVLAQGVLRVLTGQTSDLAIVLSTLGIAALFNPLRHRIQRTIDSRFFRRKYNAERTLEAFSLAVRDEVDLDKLQAALIGVVQETMQPTKISLWVKKEKV